MLRCNVLSNKAAQAAPLAASAWKVSAPGPADEVPSVRSGASDVGGAREDVQRGAASCCRHNIETDSAARSQTFAFLSRFASVCLQVFHQVSRVEVSSAAAALQNTLYEPRSAVSLPSSRSLKQLHTASVAENSPLAHRDPLYGVRGFILSAFEHLAEGLDTQMVSVCLYK